MSRRLVSFGFGVAEAAAATTTTATTTTATTTTASSNTPTLSAPNGSVGQTPFNLQRQQQDELSAAPTNFQALDGIRSDVMSNIGDSTTIATSSKILQLSSNLVTKAFDNQQDLRWIIEPPNGTMFANNVSGGTSYSSELVAFAAGQQQQQQQQQQQLQLQEQQQSFSDWWQEYWSRQPFPSGYTQSSITLVACLLTTFIFLIVVGNLLVCIAIFTEKSLKPIQNWFIASLAVSDMLLGLVVMPFSLARELMGFWVFGPLWCDIHEALDVLLTTASINTLCLISLDRYWSITQAVSYLKKRTPRRAVFMIAFVWVFSAAVSLPPLIGWKKQSPSVTAPVNSNATRVRKIQSLVQDLLETTYGKKDDSTINQAENAPPDQDQELDQELDQERDDGGGDRGQDETSLIVGETPQRRRRWQRKRRRAPTRNNQLQPSELDSVQNPMLAPDTQLHIPSGSHLIPSLAQVQRQQLQQPVINFAYLSSEPQQQLEQQQTNEYPTCQLSDDIGYVLYSALGSFYIPCAVMVFTYIKIGLAARKRARRAINKQARHQQQAGGKRGATGAGGGGGGGGGGLGGLQRRTIAGMTSGRASKQHPVGDSALLLTPTLAGLGADGAQPLDQIGGNQRRTSSSTGHHRHRNSRAFIKSSELAETVGCNRNNSTSPSGGPPVVGKPVVVERQKMVPVSEMTSSSLQQKGEIQQVATVLTVGMAKGAEVQAEQESTCCTATLVTSGSKLASPSALKYSTSCGGISLAAQQQQQQLERCPDENPLEEGLSQASSSSTTTNQQQRQQRKPTSESNDSSLITVMSASMNELPQVTRFNFTSKQQVTEIGQQQPVVQTEAQHTAAEALLRAISRAGRELIDDKISKGDESETAPQGAKEIVDVKMLDNNKELAQQSAANNSTNETCFMTIEEDSDNLESQTGRTIMMIASTAKQSSSSLANKSRVGMMMTMMPPATGATPGGVQQPNDSPTIVCNNVACLRRQARRRANRLRRSSSYCGSSMTINDDEEEEDDEDDEDDGDEEDEEDEDEEVEEDELLANGGGGGGDSVDMMDEDDDDEDEHDGCLDEDVLTDDCNGYSGGSCRLGAYCTGTVSSICTHCRECAALSTGTQPASSGECLQDSPLSCDAATYNYSKCTLQDDSPLMNAKNVISSSKCLNATSCRKRTNKRPKRHASQQAICHQHKQSPSSTARRHDRQQQQQQQQQQHLACNVSEMEAQSLTADDNLSLTDYYRSNEDNSSIVGHDVLDATPARERLGPKRRSIVASAIATVGGGLNRMAAAAANQQHVESAEGADTVQSAATGRKKSSIGFHLSRFASGGGGLTGVSNPTAGGGGLLALAAASQQQQQQQIGGGNATRNLKTLRQNFFHKLNQLTAKSAAKEADNRAKSSAPSSYGSSYEPSIDYATTSNMHSTNDQYQMETTFGETDDYEQQTSETTKQSSETTGGQLSPGRRLMTIAQQASAAAAAASSGLATKQDHSLMGARGVQQARVNQNQRPQTINVTSDLSEKQTEFRGGHAHDEPKARQPDGQQFNVTTEGGVKNNQLFNSTDRQANARITQDTRANNADGPTQVFSNAHKKIKSGQVKRRSTDKNDASSMALVCSNQGSSSEQRLTGTNAIVRQGTGFASSSGGGGGNVINKAFLASDNERHKRKLAKARERRATLILGLIMATFVSCWFPFFSFYVLRAVCHVCRDYIPPRLEAFIFWMGYCNSACNPIIYTIFNRDFRKAFRKILFRCSRE